MTSRLLLLCIAMLPSTNAASQQSSIKSIGVFENKVEACSDAKNRAVWWAKGQRTMIETVLGIDPVAEIGECSCATQSAMSTNWVCELTVRIKGHSTGSIPQASQSSQRINDTRVFSGGGRSDVEACVRAKDLGVAALKGVSDSAITSFSNCSCRLDSVAPTAYSWTCSVDIHFTRAQAQPNTPKSLTF